ncbi:MAG: sulfite exporter TauE/SafE family protein [Atribacterota bacterium]
MIDYISFVGIGFITGVLSGLFGVGGGFLLVPLLNVVFNVPYIIAIGSSLVQMVGTATASTLKHRGYGHIDYKLAGFILMGSIVGAEFGARILMWLKSLGTIMIHGSTISKMDLWINLIYIVLLSLVGISMFLESKKAKKRAPRGGVVDTAFSQKIRNVKIPPITSLPISNIEYISVCYLVVLGFGVGILSGLLGIGGAFILNPALIYLIGVPTSVAIGTSLFQTIFVSGYGGLTHFFKGNVDFALVACVLVGSLVGSQLGAKIHNRLRGAYIRYYFSLVIFIAAGIVLFKFLFIIGYL